MSSSNNPPSSSTSVITAANTTVTGTSMGIALPPPSSSNTATTTTTATQPPTTSSTPISTVAVSQQLLETQRHLATLYRVLKLCRPKNMLQFMTRYLQDEKLSSTGTNNTSSSNTTGVSSSCSISTVEERHAIHMLPFLISQYDEFQSNCCVIFISQQHNNTSFYTPSSTGATTTAPAGTTTTAPAGSTAVAPSEGDSSKVSAAGSEAPADTTATLPVGEGGSEKDNNSNTVVATLPPPPQVSAKASGISASAFAYREYLDPGHILDVIQAMDLPSYGLFPSSGSPSIVWNMIEEYISEWIEPLKMIDFNLFVASLRIVVSMVQVVVFVKDEYHDFLVVTSRDNTSGTKGMKSATAPVLPLVPPEQPPFPLPDDMKVAEISRWKTYLVRYDDPIVELKD